MALGTEYTIRYYRDEFWANRFLRAGVENKPVGWAISPHRSHDRAEALRCVEHINKLGPVHPVELVVLYNGAERS